MPSTGKTPNFELNQWVRMDGVSMDDFNADNQRLDAALNAVPWVKLKDVTTSAPANQIDLDMSDIALSDYLDVIIMVRLKASNYYVLVNNITTTGYRNSMYGSAGSIYSTQTQPRNAGGSVTHTYHLSEYDGDVCLWMNGFYWYGSGDYNPSVEHGAGSTWTNDGVTLETLNFVNGSGIGAGSRIVVYGVR